VRFGLHTGPHHVSFAELSSLWRSAEEWGFDACYVFDHFVPLHSDVEAFLPEEANAPDGPCLEGVASLAALARAVPRIGVGLMVAAVGYRSPGQLAHAVATIAQAAPGRVEIGIGAGWFEREYRAFGVPFPAARERMDQLEGALEALAAWMRGDAAAVRGVAVDAPLPQLQPSPRLWVAGVGEKRLLPLAARYADSWNAMYLTPEEYRAKVEILLERCEAGRRNPATLERSIALRAFCAREPTKARSALEAWAAARGRDPERLAVRSLVGSPAECAEQLRRYEEAGATHVAVMAHPPYDSAGLELFAAEVMPAFRSP
jgi:alkanesulfonate monooxygenase SsuD/methylene tetrahydromethanopterin reductase-like flavin-dependent oxidoreductase (luciferase family)